MRWFGRLIGRLIGRVLRLILILVVGYALLVLVGLALFRYVDPPATPLMLLRLTEGEGLDHRPVPLAQVSPHLPRAVVAAEDNRFCQHHGVDPDAIAQVIEEYRSRGRLRGASTLTMQLARNLFLWPGGGVVRKAVELPIALALDAGWPKWRILEVYLQVAEMGPGIYGAEAAARAHFGVAAGDLTRTRAARLAAILPAPRSRDPARPSDFVSRYATTIETRIGQLGGRFFACFEDR